MQSTAKPYTSYGGWQQQNISTYPAQRLSFTTGSFVAPSANVEVGQRAVIGADHDWQIACWDMYSE